MPSWLKGILTFVVSCALAPLGAELYHLAARKLFTSHSGGFHYAFPGGLIFGILYGLMAGILVIYDLSSAGGWLALLIDLTWSFPNTIFGFVFGNLVYPFFGAPSRGQSEGQTWIVYAPRGSSGFGHNVLQTLGNVNLGGAGQHERMHLMQARIFGPLYLPLFAVNYIITFCVQMIWVITVGGLLFLVKLRDTPYFRPPRESAVQGFFGWIYHSTLFELWAYASGNP
jgi:hypothetical protein